MSRRIDLTGRRFDKLTCVAYVGLSAHKKAIWLCQCACGNHIAKTAGELMHSPHKTKGCKECAGREIGRHHSTHGKSRSRLYRIWKGMRARCQNENSSMYRWYGAKGISVCDEWSEFLWFSVWALASGYASNLTIERINPKGNYEKANCEWITRQENTRRMNEHLRKDAH